MTWFCLEPEDVLLFRDSRPFAAGEEHRARGTFPPLPGAVAGAIRSQLLQRALRDASKTFSDYARGSGTEIEAIQSRLGTDRDLGILRLKGPLVYRYHPFTGEGEPIFARPADLVGNRVLVPMSHSATENGVTLYRNALNPLNTEDRPMLRGTFQPDLDDTEQEVAEASEWLTLVQMDEYLKGRTELTPLAEKPISPTVLETRTGIGGNVSTGAAQSGLLYEVQMHRPTWTPEKAFGLLMNCDGVTPEEGCLALGGERRAVWAKRATISNEFTQLLEGETLNALCYRIEKSKGRFRLYLLTPGIFAEGWLPRLFKEEREVRFVGAALGKPLSIGGWDLANRAPKPLYRAVPAGSVFYGQLKQPTQETIRKLVTEFHFQTALQAGETQTNPPVISVQFAQMGFGLTLVGSWNPTIPQEEQPPHV